MLKKEAAHMILTLTGSAPEGELHILLVDDDEDDRELFGAAAAPVPRIRLSTATNGKVLLDQLRGTETQDLPQLIFLDLNMPLKDGQESLREIRADQRLSAIPVIIYSTSQSPDILDDVYEMGADYYIRKPNSFVELRQIVKKVGSMAWSVHMRHQRSEFVLF